ncbi:MAG: TerB family tellurite resistance protein [Chromatiales bacterium]|nr:MAG: TerB family tellurite resistance protein [Chromatiales bacterium]
MFKSLYEKIVSQISAADIEADERDAAVRLATAVLMVDVALVDSSFDETEFDRMLGLIKRQFGLGTQEAADLINAANAKADEQVSVQELTELLNEHLEQDEKARVVRLLWSIAYSDGQLDKYENSLVLKISDLLGVSSEQAMHLKHETDSGARDVQH